MLCIYATKHGNTKKLIELISEGYFFETKEALVSYEVGKDNLELCLDGEKNIILITPIYYNAPLKVMDVFVKRYWEILKEKKIIFCLVGANTRFINDEALENGYFKFNEFDKKKYTDNIGSFSEVLMELWKKATVYFIEGIVDTECLSPYELMCNGGINCADNINRVSLYYEKIEKLRMLGIEIGEFVNELL